MIYQYECTSRDCQHKWEQWQRMTAEPIEVCPKCSKASAKRRVTGGQGFTLEPGPGFVGVGRIGK